VGKTRRVVLIFGRTGSGKTYLARQIAQREKRIVILDPMHQFSGTVFTSFDAFAAYIEPRLDTAFDFRIVCRFRDDVDIEYFFILARQIQGYTLCIDEAEIFLEPRSMNEDFLQIIRYGRHNEISLIAVARRVPELSVDLRAQADSLITFNQTLPGDLKNLEAYGFDPEAIRALGKYKYVVVGEHPRT
jgi:DNA helicase HerA-like ATPase